MYPTDLRAMDVAEAARTQVVLPRRRAKAMNDRIYPLARAFYADPFVDMHNRMKEALVLLGRLPRAVVRPPLVKLGAAEIERIRMALVAAGLLDERASRAA